MTLPTSLRALEQQIKPEKVVLQAEALDKFRSKKNVNVFIYFIGHIIMSNGFVVTSLLMLFIFVSTAAAGDGHSPQIAAVHAVLTH